MPWCYISEMKAYAYSTLMSGVSWQALSRKQHNLHHCGMVDVHKCTINIHSIYRFRHSTTQPQNTVAVSGLWGGASGALDWHVV